MGRAWEWESIQRRLLSSSESRHWVRKDGSRDRGTVVRYRSPRTASTGKSLSTGPGGTPQVRLVDLRGVRGTRRRRGGGGRPTPDNMDGPATTREDGPLGGCSLGCVVSRRHQTRSDLYETRATIWGREVGAPGPGD